jgi:hypothetical protein
MRGFDYRAKTEQSGTCDCKSFAYEHEAIQSLNRVGRFGDQCKGDEDELDNILNAINQE